MPLLYISAVILAILISWGSITLLSNSNEQTKIQVAMNEIIAPKGSKTQLTLSDGTVIWLNAGSKLLYPKNYSLENRKVYLTGEAYFKVVHDSKHSFIVYTSEAEIRDLGTTFNVKAYLDGSTTETTLIEGSVEVMLRKNPDQKILMFPKEKLILHNQAYDQSLSSIVRENSGQIFEVSKIIPFSKTNDIVETAWLSDKLIFRNQRFEDLAKEMERKYNVNMIVKSDVVKDYTLTGIFRNENIEEALNLLQVIAPFKYKINESTIIIEN